MEQLKKIFYQYYPIITGLISFLVYITTMFPTLAGGDSGELAAVQATLGIAHPTGYPLFSLLGFLWYHILFPLKTIYALNLLSATLCASTVTIVVKITKLLLSESGFLVGITRVSQSNQNTNNELTKIMASLFAGFSFAFSVTFWIQSSKVEVHALQMFIFALIIYFSLKTYIVIELKQSNKHLYYFYKWWLVFLLIGFGFSNHLMTVYLVPGTILLYFLRNNVNSKSIINLFYLGFLTFVVSFIFYLGMMYRANTAAGNAYMFGTPSDIIKILEYVSGHHYSYLMFSGMASFYKQFTLFVNYLSFDFSREYFVGGEFSISNVFIIIGFFISLLLYRRFFYYSVLTIIFSLLIAFNYNILDIEEYFLLSFLFFSLFIGLSINFLLSLCQNKQFIKVVSIVLLTFILFSQMFLNYKGVDNSNNYFYYDYPKAIIGSLNQNSIIVDGETAEIYSQYTFFNNYLNFRKDTYVVIINMLRSFTINTDTGIKVFSFEEMSRLLNYYVTPKVFKNYILTGKFKLDQNAYVIPDVLCYRIVRDHSYYAAANPDFIIRETKNTIYSKNKILFEIAEVLEKRINYELAFNKVDRALIYYLKIVKDFPDYTLAGKTLKKLSMLK